MKISVITICYNAVDVIERTLCSVVEQHYTDFEYIVVDGGSKDGTIDLIRRNESHISKWVSESDAGIYHAMNKGVRMSTGDYCIFMNAGDMFASSLVLQQISVFLDNKNNLIVGNEISFKYGKIVNHVYPPQKLTLQYLFSGSISHQSSFIMRSFLLEYPYDENLKLVSDWKFWIEAVVRGTAKYEVVNIDVCFFDQNGSTSNNIELGRKERRQVLIEFLTNQQLEECVKNVHHNDLRGLFIRLQRRLIRECKLVSLPEGIKNEFAKYQKITNMNIIEDYTL